MNKKYTELFIHDIITMAWDDDIPFDIIKKNTGLSEAEVIKIMRGKLKLNSFKLWRKRVSGRRSKHQKKLCFT